MKELSVNKLENLEGGKFWGTTETCHDEYDASSGCTTTYCDYVTQRFWIVTERLNHIPSGTTC
ncbi:hypothetical protein [Tenacibaculum sediminilitoris]|uniref:hypothetical protein n=1 Tax=Tenacibaculum sediminilitoris TaxID=1820334 RepID=UPI0038B4719A